MTKERIENCWKYRMLGWTEPAIAEKLGLTRNQVHRTLYWHKNPFEKEPNQEPVQMDFLDTPKKEEPPVKRVAIQNFEPAVYIPNYEGSRINFALIGDTHLGSKYAQITHLLDFYKYCERQGITDVYHTGDVTDGINMRQGHNYELYAPSADELISHVVNVYPTYSGVTTHFITGNHDASLYKQIGLSIGEVISQKRSDMNYLGRDCAVVKLTDNCTLELRHPWDGTAYAISYKIQKLVEAFESDSKPNILAVGHYHKQEMLFYRNVHIFQTACFQGQTPFTRGKGMSVVEGGWIISVSLDKIGRVKTITPEFVPFYKSIEEDYKKYI